MKGLRKMRNILLAAVAAVILGGAAQAACDEPTWQLYRNSFDGAPPVLVATFNALKQDGTLDDRYNQQECDIIKGLVVADNATRPVHLDYWCVKLPAGATLK
jgi:hypothetical protein